MRTKYRKLVDLVGEWVRRREPGSVFTVRDVADALGASDNSVQYWLERHPEVKRPDPERRQYRKARKESA